jgi:ankyrin repeat protein
MSEPVRSFDRMIIPAPCKADWDKMIGNDRVRFCEHCNLHVTNLSSLTRQAAIRLVARSQGRLCVRMVKRSDGSVLTKQMPKQLHQIARRVSRVAASAFTATLSLATVAAQTGSASTSPPRENVVAESPLSSVEIGCSLSGVISDPHGAVISRAVVTLINLKNNSFFTFVTADDGGYKITLLPAGSYQLAVNASSFVPSVDELQLADGVDRAINVELKLPEIIEEVQIIELPTVVEFSGGGAVAFIEPEEPIVKAAFKQDLEAVKQLAFSALDLNVRDKYTNTTALEQAIETGNLEIVRTLLLAGASVNVEGEGGRTALMYLRDTASADLVRELVSAGVKVHARDESGGTALMNAALFSNYAVVKELLDAGAKVSLKDADGKTALMFAAENADPRVSKILIDAGAEIDARDSDDKTALMIAAAEGDPETVRLLISFNADINAVNKEGRSALMFAANVDDFESVQALVNAGADLTFKDKEGKTALTIARDSSVPEMAKLLESRGAPE